MKRSATAGRTALIAVACLAAAPALLSPAATAAGAATTANGSGLARAAREILGAGQGVYVEAADGRVLLAQAADRPVHPASVSKVPTTLALLRKLGPDYRFTTTFTLSGQMHGGQVTGQLRVQSAGQPNPALVDEDALLVAERLNALGVRAVAGPLLVQGPMTFDWQADPQGVRLAQALSGHTPPAAWHAVVSLQTSSIAPSAAVAAASPPAVRFLSDASDPNAAAPATGAAAVPVSATSAVSHVLVLRSEPLLPLLKSLDDFSNNIVAPLAQAAGGAAAVEQLARASVPAGMRGEITLGDGAGTDPRNRLSPRAAVKLLRALEQQLATSGHALPDVLPVSGVDAGTLQDRLNGPNAIGRVVGKTGTYGDYGASALIGAIRTRDRGEVYFAILDHGVPVAVARHRQDEFVRALLARLQPLPWGHSADPLPAIARAQLTVDP